MGKRYRRLRGDTAYYPFAARTGLRARQRRRARRPLILPHHGSVHHAVDGRDQGAAKGGGEVFEVNRSDPIRQKIHRMTSIFQVIHAQNAKRAG